MKEIVSDDVHSGFLDVFHLEVHRNQQARQFKVVQPSVGLAPLACDSYLPPRIVIVQKNEVWRVILQSVGIIGTLGIHSTLYLEDVSAYKRIYMVRSQKHVYPPIFHAK